MNYIDQIAIDIYNHGDPGGSWRVPDADDMRLYRIYAVLALAKGTETTLEDVHDAWAAWRSDTNPEHRSIIPFDELSHDVQEMDREYCDAIHAIAQKEVSIANVQ